MLVSLRVANASDESRFIELTGTLIDTRSMWTTIPAACAEQLGLVDLGGAPSWSGSSDTSDRHSYASLGVLGRSTVLDVLVSETQRSVVGLVALTAMGLAFDIEQQTLRETELLLMYPSS